MFTRFSMNVRRFPRTFVVLCLAIVGTLLVQYGVGRGVGIDARRVSLNILALVAIAIVIDGILYNLYLRSSLRVGALISILDTFEGRTSSESLNDDGCGDPNCESCYPSEDEKEEGTDLINDESGQDIAEYAVMLAVMLVIVIGTIRLIGSSAGNVFSSIGSQIGNAQ
jgi:Flp pilus assembly pilin Flp